MDLPSASAYRMVVPMPLLLAPPLVQQEPLQAGRYPQLGRRSGSFISSNDNALFLTTPVTVYARRHAVSDHIGQKSTASRSKRV